MYNHLISCFQDTLHFSLEGPLKEHTLKAQHSNKVYPEFFISPKISKFKNAVISVCEGTSFAIARQYISSGRVAVLNFANPHYPGGGVRNGAMAQEECLCRSSNLYACISHENVDKDYYMFHIERNNSFFTDRLVYTRDVTVFKTDDTIPQMMPEKDWFQVDIITCAAPYLAGQQSIDGNYLYDVFRHRIKNIIESAIDNDVDTLILGAFGCGAFKNPPDIVAKAFHDVIQESNYQSYFDHIVFAIKNNKAGTNLAAFRQEFDKQDTSNPYDGKYFSILGDSISTLSGYNPADYKVFYDKSNCNRTGISNIKDTWWGKVIDSLNGKLLVNNAWSGSRVSMTGNNLMDLFPSGISQERTLGLHIKNQTPDVILIYLGINDWANGVPLYCDKDDCTIFQYYSSFPGAYEDMLVQLKRNYPQSEIWCCGLGESFISSHPEFTFPRCYNGNDISKYNEIIRTTAQEQNCKFINFSTPYDTIDGIHPNEAGMDTIAKMVLKSLCAEMCTLPEAF